MKRLLVVALAALISTSAVGQTVNNFTSQGFVWTDDPRVANALTSEDLGQPYGPLQSDSAGSGGGVVVSGRTLAAVSADTINVKNAPYNAAGNGQRQVSTYTLAAGSKALAASSPVFANATAGMIIGVPQAGAAATTGVMTAIPVLTPGAGYTALPTITLSGSPTVAATPGVLMGLVSATVAAGGTGCTVSSTFTISIAPGGLYTTLPQLSVTTNSSGVVTAVASVVNPGLWFNSLPSNFATAPGNAAPCTTQPTFAISMGMTGVGFGSTYYNTGYGSGYPLTGITATLTGAAGTAATLGTPVITPYVATLLTTIASVQDASHVTLAAPAVTAVAQSETVTYGTNDTAAIQAALNAASGNSAQVIFPNSSGCYLSDMVNVPSFVRLSGYGVLCMSPASLNPLLSLGTSTDVEISQLRLVGNMATSLNPNTGSSGINASPGAARLYFHDLVFTGWTRHAMALDGITDIRVLNNHINGAWFGAGILLSSATTTSNAVVTGNVVSNTQLAGVSVEFALSGGSISDNQVTATNAGFGDSTHGNVQDCITGYSADATNQNVSIMGNVLISCGNNGLHWGGSNVAAIGNTVVNAQLYCILLSGAPSSLPVQTNNVKAIGNHCTGLSKTDSTKGGIALRNVQTGVVSGNTATNVYMGIELYGFAGTVGDRDITVSGNAINSSTICIWLRKRSQYNIVTGNTCQIAAVGVDFDNNALSGDTSGSSPDFFNFIGPNAFDAVTNPINENAGGNETITAQSYQNASGANIITNAGTFIQPIQQSFAVGSMPSAVTYKQTCVNVTGSTTGNVLACSNGTNWLWVKDNSTVTT